jgi:hypothetical protein
VVNYANFQRIFESRLGITAAFSIVALISAIGWNVYAIIAIKNRDLNVIARQKESAPNESSTILDENIDPNGFGLIDKSSEANDISSIGPSVVGQLAANYFALQSQGMYTPELGKQIAAEMAPHVRTDVPFHTYSVADIKIKIDKSDMGINKYHNDMRTALAPLSKNKRLELEIYAMYVDTQDTKYLDQLRTAAINYRLAADATAKVLVPQDARSYHIALLNALQEFASVLDAMADNAEDPITSAALLRSYNQAEENIFASFGSLITYVQKHS